MDSLRGIPLEGTKLKLENFLDKRFYLASIAGCLYYLGHSSVVVASIVRRFVANQITDGHCRAAEHHVSAQEYVARATVLCGEIVYFHVANRCPARCRGRIGVAVVDTCCVRGQRQNEIGDARVARRQLIIDQVQFNGCCSFRSFQ